MLRSVVLQSCIIAVDVRRRHRILARPLRKAFAAELRRFNGDALVAVFLSSNRYNFVSGTHMHTYIYYSVSCTCFEICVSMASSKVETRIRFG